MFVEKLSEIEFKLLEGVETAVTRSDKSRTRIFWEVVCFAIVGVANTVIDLMVLNCLLFLLPTHSVGLLIGYNSVAYAVGAFNSFILNKYWTFHRNQRTTNSELLRFALVNLFGIVCNNSLLWAVASMAHPFMVSAIVWANVSKVLAIAGTATISFLGMRLWVFAGQTRRKSKKEDNHFMLTSGKQNLPSSAQYMSISPAIGSLLRESEERNAFLTNYSLSVILPAHNEEAIIAQTVHTIISILTPWVQDFEVIVVNDGSKDNTGAIVEEIAANDHHVCLINHTVNQGYGAALVSGFTAVTKDLAFFTDSDGQFDICDLERFFPLIEQYDAVLGYRQNRQDTWIRKLNAWGWKMLVSFIFHIQVQDVDCAFKLYRADFFRRCELETRGAMINTEILYKLKLLGYTYTQVGVNHYPRTSGQATGAKLSVILRAFRELFTYAHKWHQEERLAKKVANSVVEKRLLS
jgi:putative flippase GtrA